MTGPDDAFLAPDDALLDADPRRTDPATGELENTDDADGPEPSSPAPDGSRGETAGGAGG